MGKVWHVVLYQAKPGHEEALAAALAAARVWLVAEIPGFLEFRRGRDFGGRAAGFTNGIVAQFANRATLDGRVRYPAHRIPRETTQPHVASPVAFDFEE